MKLATVVLMGIARMGSLVPWNANGPAGPGKVAIAFTGGSVWNPDGVSGTCKWYLPMVGWLGVATPNGGAASITLALFNAPANPYNTTAYLVWVSDFKIVTLSNGRWPLFLGATGNVAARPRRRDADARPARPWRRCGGRCFRMAEIGGFW